MGIVAGGDAVATYDVWEELMVQITIDPKQLAKLTKAVDHIKNGVPRALTPAINRALASGKTVVKREIRKEYLIKAKDIPIALHKASYGKMRGEIVIKDGMMPLGNFKVSPKGVQKRKNKQIIKAQVKRSASGGPLPHAFNLSLGNYTGPFMRYHGVGRLPIHRLLTISAPIMASQPTVGPAVNKVMGDTLAKRIDHEIVRLLEKAGGK